MSESQSPQSASVETLCQRCATETARFRKDQPPDNRWCWELLHRALEKGDQHAWWCVNAQYKPMVDSWVRRHPRFWGQIQEAEDLTQEALRKFARVFTAGVRTIASFSGLPQLLGYLKRCANSVVIDWARKQRRERFEDLPPPPPPPNSAADLWREVAKRCRTEREVVAVTARFRLGLMPREIWREYPALFKSPHDVSDVLAKVLIRLRDEDGLRDFLA